MRTFVYFIFVLGIFILVSKEVSDLNSRDLMQKRLYVYHNMDEELLERRIYARSILYIAELLMASYIFVF